LQLPWRRRRLGWFLHWKIINDDPRPHLVEVYLKKYFAHRDGFWVWYVGDCLQEAALSTTCGHL
jgi:hypothetical protein